MLPSCSPGVFRQKSFRSSTPPVPSKPSKVSPTATLSPTCTRNSRNASASATIATNDRCASRTATPIVPSPTVVVTAAAVSPRDGSSRTVSTAPLSSLSRGARAASKHARLGTALASKMATASASTVVQGWPNTKDDYELKEVIGEYRSPPCGTRQVEATIAWFESAEDRARTLLDIARGHGDARHRHHRHRTAGGRRAARVVFLIITRRGTAKIIMTVTSTKRESPFRASYRSSSVERSSVTRSFRHSIFPISERHDDS